MAATQFLAGGTTILDLMKLDVMQPQRLVDVNRIDADVGRIERPADIFYLGAFATMAAVADHPDVRRDYPVVVQALDLAASAQIRNMATLGGNVLQRTRCNYFRDHCCAAYPGDFAQALVALDAAVEITGSRGPRVMPFEQLHRMPGDTPHIETVLKPGELIIGFRLPVGLWTRRSLYLKIRDRQSYEFALASAAVVLDLVGDTVNEARIALGGVATKPWRAREAEATLKGRAIDEATAERAAGAAFAGAQTRGDNAYKVELGKRTLVRALLQASQLSV